MVLADLLNIVFANKEDTMAKVHRSFKVHAEIEESKQIRQTTSNNANTSGWLGKGNTTTTKAAKVINFWCFNPGFGMEQLLNTHVRSVILTSGTLAPLKPLIAELAIPVAQHLENPHIVNQSQVYVKIIGMGPDREQLVSNYKNRCVIPYNSVNPHHLFILVIHKNLYQLLRSISQLIEMESNSGIKFDTSSAVSIYLYCNR